MAEPVHRPWTVEEFFAWQEGQRERYELVGGRPVRMMAGARNVHDDIVVNLVAELRDQLRGGPCRPFTGDGSLETLPGQIRRPDLGVDCGRRDPDGLQAAIPKMVVEVLSPGTRDFDTFEKLGEYKTVESLVYILFVEPNAPEIIVWERTADGDWARREVAGLDAAVALPTINVSLALRDVYDGVDFPPRPQLVRKEPSR